MDDIQMDIERQHWVLEMWLETCKNHGIEIEHSDDKKIMRMRVIKAMRKEGLME